MLGARLANTPVVLAFVVVIVVRIPTAVHLGRSRKAWSAWRAHDDALNRQEV